jgi:hypothetical protein
MTNERYLLNLYVHPESEYRRNIQDPFRQDGRICATDGRMMIRIAEGLCEEEYTDTPNGLKPVNTNAVMPEPNMCETVTALMLNHALEKAPDEKDRRCPECNGSGEVEYEYHDRHGERHTTWDDCPECDGTGEVGEYTAIEYQFTLHGHALAYKHLKMLLRTMAYLQTNSLRLRHIQKGDDDTQALLFDVDGKDIEILAMPQLRDENLKEIKIKEG